MISVRNITKAFGSSRVLDGVSLEVARGETVVLLGPSGSGKSTLLRCIVGLEKINSGEIEVDGVVLSPDLTAKEYERRSHEIRLRCGLLFQQFHLFPHLTVLQNLTLAPIRVRGASREEAEQKAMALLHKLGLADKARMRPGKLSGGEQQRVAIARALAMRPDYLLYDEPTSSLDLDRAREIWRLMGDLARQGQAQLVVTHQYELANAVACRVVKISGGRIVANNSVSSLVETAQVH
ncbi:MAG: amino acid ABC transporter ATP-binding protein [Candidatus Sumerlaeaceae bacterium]|nr:amino acid ABC transporter ATP-binding protein [Candidatus Sumerlaeaceae bacterium]